MSLPAERKSMRPVLLPVSARAPTDAERLRLAAEHLAKASRTPALDRAAADQLSMTMRLVKGARFNAAERLELKQAVSLFTQSMVALYFVGLAVWQAVYVGAIDEPTNRLVTFIQLVSSVFTLMLGLLEALNDYKVKAHHLHNCALQVSEIVQELRVARPVDPDVLQEFRRRYSEALKGCPVNHNRIDYLFAKMEEGGDMIERVAVTARYVIDVYGLYFLFLAVPPLLLWVHM